MKKEFYIVNELTGYARAIADEGQKIEKECLACGRILEKRKMKN